ncbi:MAG: hypothetical protein AB7V42_07365 [Thermoleophilia bacterium]
MARRNRVTPFGELIAAPERGALMGNRGCLHDGQGRIVRFADGRRWIVCLLSFKGRRREPMPPGRYTSLFFHDEATALAAGHRPCAECRRADALAFRAAWARATGEDPAIPLAELDRALHAERYAGRGRMRRWRARPGDLPDGAMVDVGGAAHLVWRGGLRPWSPAGYGPPTADAPRGPVPVLTPPSTTGAIRAGYVPATSLGGGRTPEG